MINNNDSKINIYENNSYYIHYFNQNENDPVIFNNKLKSISPTNQKNIIYRNDLKKVDKKQLVYEKKINLLNNNLNKNKYFDNDNNYDNDSDIKDNHKINMIYYIKNTTQKLIKI